MNDDIKQVLHAVAYTASTFSKYLWGFGAIIFSGRLLQDIIFFGVEMLYADYVTSLLMIYVLLLVSLWVNHWYTKHPEAYQPLQKKSYEDEMSIYDNLQTQQPEHLPTKTSLDELLANDGEIPSAQGRASR